MANTEKTQPFVRLLILQTRYAPEIEIMKKWEEVEEIVKLLEASISPEAEVERNVFLPDLNSTQGAKRQCDVVIRNGKPPRETITIVEVQDRTSKVDVNTFGGWCQKMRDVGAQHLVCVSKEGFPRSVQEKALKMGPTVRLLMLSQLQSTEKWPLDFFSNVVQNPRRELTRIFNAELHYHNEENTDSQPITVQMDAKDFQYNGRALSAKEIFFAHLDYLEGQGSIFQDGKHTIDMKLPMDGDELLYKLGNTYKNVFDFYASYEMDILNRKIPLICSEYKQIDFGSCVAWLMEATVFISDEEREYKLVFVPIEDGTYRLLSRMN